MQLETLKNAVNSAGLTESFNSIAPQNSAMSESLPSCWFCQICTSCVTACELCVGCVITTNIV